MIVRVSVCLLLMTDGAQELDDLKEQRTRLLGDCLLGSSFLCYVGAFSWEFRHEMIYDMWWKDIVKREIPVSKPFRIEALLTNEVEMSKYVMLCGHERYRVHFTSLYLPRGLM